MLASRLRMTDLGLMRVRVIKHTTGRLDGFDLSRFEVGQIYDVSSAFATFLIETGSGQLVADDTPALVVPLPRSDEPSTRRTKQ